MESLYIYTDGAYSAARNQGGWAYVIVKNDNLIFKKSGYDINSDDNKVTNNTMEMIAVIEAIEDTVDIVNKHHLHVEIISDSLYVVNTLKGIYKIKTNKDIWKRLDDIDLSCYSYTHIRGHQGNKFNEICDELAVHQSKIIKYEA